MAVSVETFVAGPDGAPKKYEPTMFSPYRGRPRGAKGEKVELTQEQKELRRQTRRARANRSVDGFSILTALAASEKDQLSLSEVRALSGNRGADTRLIHSTLTWLLNQGLVHEERDGRAIWYALSQSGHEFATNNSRSHGAVGLAPTEAEA